MKTVISLKIITWAAVLGAVLSAPVLAQTGPGPGPGARGMRGMMFDDANTPGWMLMTEQERIANRNRMREVKTYEECKQVQAEHHLAMQARAKEKGVTLRSPRQNACDVAKARGWIQ